MVHSGQGENRTEQKRVKLFTLGKEKTTEQKRVKLFTLGKEKTELNRKE